MQYRHLAVKGSERLGLRFEFKKSLLQHSHVIISPSHERSIAIRTNRALREFRAFNAGSEPADAALETARDTVAHSLFRHFEPNRQVESCAQSRQDRRQTFSLWEGSGKTVKDESMAAVQAQPVFDQFNNDFVRNEVAALQHFRRLLPQRRAEIFFAAQNRARRSDGNTELARNHFRLGSFAGTGRAEKNESSFHLSAVKENGNPGNSEHGDANIEPHKRAARGRFAAAVGSTIK